MSRLVGVLASILGVVVIGLGNLWTVGNAAPMLTVVWAIWPFHEALTAPLILVGALTLGGILWTNRPQTRPRPVARLDPRLARE